jgi:Tfp pilus assembly protein PilN
MITINLRPGQKRKRGGGRRGEWLAQLKEFGSRVKDPLLLGAMAVWGLVIAFLAWGFISTGRQLANLEPTYEQSSQEAKRYQNLVQQKRQAERIRDSLLKQITTIRSVDGDRYVWPHVLDEVTKALPAYTWLTTVNYVGTAAGAVDSADTTKKALTFDLGGRTIDIQAYTRFLRQLEASPWITNVTPLEAKTLVERERPVTGFTIRATFTRADSAYVRTVPLNQSVR